MEGILGTPRRPQTTGEKLAWRSAALCAGMAASIATRYYIDIRHVSGFIVVPALRQRDVDFDLILPTVHAAHRHMQLAMRKRAGVKSRATFSIVLPCALLHALANAGRTGSCRRSMNHLLRLICHLDMMRGM